MALRRYIENDTSNNKGNFLESIHLIAKYDSVLHEHLVLKCVRKHILMSPQIQNEFITILGNNIHQHIIE